MGTWCTVSPATVDCSVGKTLIQTTRGDFLPENLKEEIIGPWASLVAQCVKRLPAMWETWVRSPGREVPLEKAVATHSRTLAWKVPWTEEPGGLQSMGLQGAAQD